MFFLNELGSKQSIKMLLKHGGKVTRESNVAICCQMTAPTKSIGRIFGAIILGLLALEVIVGGIMACMVCAALSSTTSVVLLSAFSPAIMVFCAMGSAALFGAVMLGRSGDSYEPVFILGPAVV